MTTVYYMYNEVPFGTLAHVNIDCSYLFTREEDGATTINIIAIIYKSKKDLAIDMIDKERKLIKQYIRLSKHCAKVILATECLTPDVIKFSLKNNIVVYCNDLIMLLQTCLEYVTPNVVEKRAYTISMDGYEDAIKFLAITVGVQSARLLLEAGSIEEHVYGVVEYKPSFLISQSRYNIMFRDIYDSESSKIDSLITNCGDIKGLGKKYKHLTLTEFFNGIDGNKDPLSVVRKISGKTITTYQKVTKASNKLDTKTELSFIEEAYFKSKECDEDTQPQPVQQAPIPRPRPKLNGKALPIRCIQIESAEPTKTAETNAGNISGVSVTKLIELFNK